MKVFVNFGHGGNDSGAIGNGLKEKDLTKKIGEKVVSLLKDYDVTVKSFQQSGSQTLKHITDEANKWGADLFVSIHINAGGGTGFESFMFNGSVNSKTSSLQNAIHSEIMKSIKKYNVTDRGKKKQNFHVLRETKMPACLTENMFIDTKKDADLLKNNNFISDVAKGHVNGIVRFTGAKKMKTENSDNSTYYRVVAGSYRNRKNADSQVKKLKEKGFDSFIDVFKK